MKNHRKLLGIDLVRCVAIYGVILLHSDEGISTYPQGWSVILEFSSFAVPFFLATSFYLTFNKLYKTGGQYLLKERLARLLVPYFVWTLLYILYKILKYFLQNETDKFSKLFQDPIGIILFGGAAFQLYFLPLLVGGTILVKALSFLIKNQVKTEVLIGLASLNLVVYEILLVTGNSFQIGSGIGFQSLLNHPSLLSFKDSVLARVILTELALIIRCLPYIFVAMILSKIDMVSLGQRKSKIVLTILWVFAFLLINIFGGYFLPKGTYELAQGFTALLAGITLSEHLQLNKIINSLSACSFGIYLIHLLFVEILQTVEARIYPGDMFRISTANLLIFSLLILAFSWMATDILMKKKSIAKILFGV